MKTRAVLATALVVVAAATAAHAQLNTSDPYLYGTGRNYHQISPPVHFATAGGFFDVFFDLEMHGPPVYPPPPGAHLGAFAKGRAPRLYDSF